MPFEVSVEDQRWHGGPKFIDVVLNSQNLKINESKMVSPVVSYYRFKAAQYLNEQSNESLHNILHYKMNAKLITQLPIILHWMSDKDQQIFHLQYTFNDQGPVNITQHVTFLAFELWFLNENNRQEQASLP